MPSARPPVPKARETLVAARQAFPPQAQEADDLLQVLAEEASVEAVNAARLALSSWTDSILEMLAEVDRGPTSEDPLEEVWHWLAASERLARSLSFAEHFSVAGLASRLEREDSKELQRWHNAVRQLRTAQKESSWNARYLRVIEEPLARLQSDSSEQLPKVLATLMRSLRRIHSSSQLREHCMVRLLQKVLKVLLSRAGHELPPIFQVAAKCYRADEAVHFRDSFQCFVENYFVKEESAGAEKTPRAMQRPGSADRAQGRQNGLGWWRATVRHSQELAENAARLCGRLAGILTDVASLRAALPQLQGTDAGLRHEVQGFLELYSGARSSLSAAEVLDLKRCHEAQAQLSEVQKRLDQLTARCGKAGVDMCLDPGEGSETTAEVLILDSSSPVVNVPAMQESIHSLQEDLDEMGSQLETFSQLIDKASFAPPSRRSQDDGEAASLAAQEVARRSSWFHRPPAVVPKDVPMIQVSDRISQRVIGSCDGRPRTSQPVMVVMAQVERPHTAEPQVSPLSPSALGEPSGPSTAGSEDDQDPPEDAAQNLPSEADEAERSENGDAEDAGVLQYECSWQVS